VGFSFFEGGGVFCNLWPHSASNLMKMHYHTPTKINVLF
jgi:hypothetical protein